MAKTPANFWRGCETMQKTCDAKSTNTARILSGSAGRMADRVACKIGTYLICTFAATIQLLRKLLDIFRELLIRDKPYHFSNLIKII